MAMQKTGGTGIRIDSTQVELKLRRLGDNMDNLLAQALNHFAEITLGEAVDITPKDSGNLWRSAKVYPHATPNDLVATLSYGTDYALYVHEIPAPPQKSKGGRSARHFPPYGKGGQWKYLETPIKARGKTLEKDMAGYIKKRLAKAMR